MVQLYFDISYLILVQLITEFEEFIIHEVRESQ